MRIIVSIALDGRSAGSWYAVETARRLQQRGHRVLFLPRPQGQTIDMARRAGLEVKDDLDLEKKSPLRMYRNFREMVRLIGDFRPDVVLAHWGEDHSLWGITKTMVAHRMALIRVRALDPKPPKRHPLSIWLHRRATDMVVTVNTRLLQAYRDRLRIPSDRISMIEAGIEPERFTDESDAGDWPESFKHIRGDPVVVLVARFSPVKGYRVLSSAIPRVRRKHPRAHFLWIGFPSEYTRDMLERWLVESNLSNAVTVIDSFQTNLPALMKRCTVGLVTSTGSESVSRVLLEYMACGLPVVATDVGGIPDLMKRGDFGVLVPPDNPESLADGIIELLDDPERATRRGQAAKDHVHRFCTWEQRVNEWEDLLYRVVARIRGETIPGKPPCENTATAIKPQQQKPAPEI